MSFPNFTQISDYAVKALESRKGKTIDISKLNCYIKLYSGTGALLYANPNIQLFSAAGDSNPSTIYGNKERSGIVGVRWDGTTPIMTSQAGQPGKPSPVVTSLEIDEGEGNLSRKAKIVIRCFSVSQLNDIMGYYLEPGFTIFMQWGWNTPLGIKYGGKVYSAAEMANFQNITAVEDYRRACGGQSDIYLGFITGGSVATSDSYWDVNIKCCGFTELPAYLMAADNQRDKTANAVDGQPEVDDYSTNSWFYQDQLKYKRWKLAFNALPSNKKTKLVKQLEKDERTSSPINYINFDPKISEDVNTNKDSSWFGRIFGDDDNIKVADESGRNIDVDIADGVKLIGDERFIRFEALATIMNRLENKGYKIGPRRLRFAINTSATICGAFDNIFSTDRTKLFIPNKNTPGPSFYEVAATGTSSTKAQFVDNEVKFDGKTVAFPNNAAIENGTAKNVWDEVINLFYKYDKSAPYKRKERTWGFLNDLYVNFDFAKGILETKNFLIKDALYQILNGISTAAGGYWDFQIQENPNPDTGTMELSVVDMNIANQNAEPEKITEFDLTGANSIFLESNFDMDIGGAMMNQIIGEKNAKSLNSSSPTAEGKLFTNKKDLIAVEVYRETGTGQEKWDSSSTDTDLNVAPEGEDASDEEQQRVTQAFAAFLGKVCLAPRVEITEGKWTDKPYERNYMCAYADQAWFELFKIGADASEVENGGVSILLPIKFTFTSHGVSGIKRGDKFIVKGLPQQYSDAGFFQVTGIKHIISGMLWKTEVIGGFRQIR